MSSKEKQKQKETQNLRSQRWMRSKLDREREFTDELMTFSSNVS